MSLQLQEKTFLFCSITKKMTRRLIDTKNPAGHRRYKGKIEISLLSLQCRFWEFAFEEPIISPFSITSLHSAN
jgi:hypothetical protein